MQSVWQADVSDFKKEKIFLYQLPIICHKHVKVPFLVDMNRIIFIAKKAGPFLTRSSQSWEWLWLALKIQKKEIHRPYHSLIRAFPTLPLPRPRTSESAARMDASRKQRKPGRKKICPDETRI